METVEIENTITMSNLILDNAAAINWVLTEIPNPPDKWNHYLKNKKWRIRKKYQNRIDNMPRKTLCGKFDGYDREYGVIGSLNPYLELSPEDLYIGVSNTEIDSSGNEVTEPNCDTGYGRIKASKNLNKTLNYLHNRSDK